MRKRWVWLLPVTLPLALVAWAALAPIELPTRDELFEIPQGTYARRMAGDKVEILPDRIDLTLGLNDVLLLRNRDEVPQQFGPVLIMPGQSFRLPFEVASSYSFACSAHASGQMAVVVAPTPARGWPALQWRWQRFMKNHWKEGR
ncbi:cupredoxin domain-containing protein [Roseateles sp. P5_E4]